MMKRHVVRLTLAGILDIAGIGHFTSTSTFRAQVPAFLPAPDVIIYVSGVIELVLATALVIARHRRSQVGLATATFFVAIFPGNLAQYFSHTPAFGLDTDTARFVRLLFQPVLVAMSLWSTGAWALVKDRIGR
jgi:uncharacterized membrane protein